MHQAAASADIWVDLGHAMHVVWLIKVLKIATFAPEKLEPTQVLWIMWIIYCNLRFEVHSLPSDVGIWCKILCLCWSKASGGNGRS